MVDGDDIERVGIFKYLGAWIDPLLRELSLFKGEEAGRNIGGSFNFFSWTNRGACNSFVFSRGVILNLYKSMPGNEPDTQATIDAV